ncbi:MAG: hypothetical protein ACR2O3_07645 [Rhizobiaceae bacterium]
MNKIRKIVKSGIAIIVALAGVSIGNISVLAQDAVGGDDVSEIARKTSNPLGGDFMVLINEWHYANFNGTITTKDRAVISHIFQPVIPLSMEEVIGENWIMVNRPTFSMIYDADLPTSITTGPQGPTATFDNFSGFGDISHFSLLGVSLPSQNDLLGPGDFVAAAGVSLNIPVGSTDLSNKAWAAGPAGVLSYIGKNGILGGLVQTQFDFADANGGDDVEYDKAFIQPFYYVNLDDGWQVGGAPRWVYDFNTGQWDLPIALGFTKTQVFDLGDGKKLPIKFGLDARYSLESSDTFGGEWEVVFTVNPIIPNVVQNLIRGCPAMSVGGC